MGETENGCVEETRIGYAHELLTAELYLRGAGWGQAFGGMSYAGIAASGLARFIESLLWALGVESWEEVRGRHVRVRRSSALGAIDEIGHVIEDRWVTRTGDRRGG